MKCTHDSGSTVICKDKNNFNIEETRKKINKCLKNNFFYSFREWPYKNVRPRIIIEQYMENSDGTDISDYKFYCFNGKAKYVTLCTDRMVGDTKFYFLNRNFELQRNMSNDGKKADKNMVINKPKNLDEMFEIAEKLSQNMKFIRVDLYDIKGKIYFGELTFYPSAGFDKNRTKESDIIFCNALQLNKENR